jgi:hypothetical protein
VGRLHRHGESDIGLHNIDKQLAWTTSDQLGLKKQGPITDIRLHINEQLGLKKQGPITENVTAGQQTKTYINF